MESKRYKNEDYSFVCGFMACRDKYMLTREKIERMLESKTPDEAVKVLQELHYGNEPESVPALEFERLLSEELQKTYSLILPFVPDQDYFEIFLYPSDYHNVKTLLKAEFLGIEAKEFLMETGSVETETMANMIRDRDYDNMRNEMAEGIMEALEEYSVSRDPQAVDFILDKACYKDMNLLASGLDSELIKGYLALKIDLINLITFIRLREMSKPVNFFSKIFIEDGNIPEEVFKVGFEEPAEQFADRLALYGLQALLMESAQMIRETGRVTVLEKLCDNYLMLYIAEAKYVTYGLEPMIAYIAAKENEIKTIRIIMAGKLAGLPPELIRERVRDTYA